MFNNLTQIIPFYVVEWNDPFPLNEDVLQIVDHEISNNKEKP